MEDRIKKYIEKYKNKKKTANKKIVGVFKNRKDLFNLLKMANHGNDDMVIGTYDYCGPKSRKINIEVILNLKNFEDGRIEDLINITMSYFDGENNKSLTEELSKLEYVPYDDLKSVFECLGFLDHFSYEFMAVSKLEAIIKERISVI